MDRWRADEADTFSTLQSCPNGVRIAATVENGEDHHPLCLHPVIDREGKTARKFSVAIVPAGVDASLKAKGLDVVVEAINELTPECLALPFIDS